ncbi:hypothetical protein ACOMHN_018728 [Nucella lapillus]
MAAHRCLVQAVVVGVNDSNVLYPACLQCYAKMLHNLQTDVWQCLRCNIRRREAELSWRYRLSVCVADTSATCHLSLFGGTLVPHFGCSANVFHQLLHTITPDRQGADEDLILQALHTALVGRRYIFCLKTHTVPLQVTPTPPQPTSACAQWGMSRPPRLADLLRGVPASQRSGGKPGDFVAVQMIPVGADGDRASVASVLEGLVCIRPDGSSVAESQGRDMSGAVPGKERGQSRGNCEPGNLPLANSCCSNQMDQTGRQGARKGVCAISSDDDNHDDNHDDSHEDGGNVRLDQRDDHQSTASDQSSFDPYYSQSSGNSQAMLGFSCQSSMDQEFPSSFGCAVAGSMSGDRSHHKENPNCAWRSDEEMKGLGSSQSSDVSHNQTGLDYLATEDFCDTSHLSGQDPQCETSKFHKRTLSITHQHSSDSTDVLAVNSDNCNVNSPSQDRLHASAAVHKPSANKETTAEAETVLGSPHTAADLVWRGGIDRSSAGRREGRDHQPEDLYGQQKMTGGHYSQKMTGGHYSQKMSSSQNHSASFSTSLNDSCLLLAASHHHLHVEDSTMLHASHHHLHVEDSTMLPHADHHHLEDSTMLPPADHHHLHLEDSMMIPADHHHLEDSTMLPADHHHLHVEDSTMLPHAGHHHLHVEDSTMLPADHHLHLEDSTMPPHAGHVSLKPAVTTSEETQEPSSVRQAGRSVCRGEDEEGRESGGERGRESGGERGRENDGESSGERGRESERGGEKGGERESAVSSVPRAVVNVEDMPFSEDLSAFLQVLAEDPSMSAVTSPPTSERHNVDKGRTDSLDPLMANADSCTMSNTRETCPKSAVEGANTTLLNEAKMTGQSGPPETLRMTSIENISSERSLMLETKQFHTPVACDGNTIIPSLSEEKTGLSVVRDTGPHRVGTAVGKAGRCSASPGGSPQCSSWVTSLPPREALRRVSGQLPPQHLFEDLTFSPSLLEQVSPEAMPPENFPGMSLPIQNGEKCQDLCVPDQEMCTGEAEQVLPAERWEKHLCVCSRQGRGSQTSPRSPVGTESEKISVQIQRSSEKGQRKSCFHKNPRRQCLQGNRHRASSYKHPDGESSVKDSNKTGSQNRCRLSKDSAVISSSRCVNKSGWGLASHRVRVQLPRDAGTAKSEQDCHSSRPEAFLQRSREVSPFSAGKHGALAMSDSRVEAMPESEDLDAFLSNLVPRNVQPSHSNTSVHNSPQEDRAYEKTPRHTASPVPVSQLAGIASSKKTHFKRSRHSQQKLNRKMSLRKSTSSDDALIWSGSQTDDSVLDCSADLFSQDTDEEKGEETCAGASGSVERSSSYQHSVSDKMSQHCKSAMTVEPQEDSLRTVEESVSSIDNTAGTVSQKSYFNTPLSGEKVILQRYKTSSKVSEEQRKVRFARKRRISSVRDMDLRLERYSSPQLESWHPCRPKPVPLTPRRSCLKECDGPEKTTCIAEIAGKCDSILPLVEIQNVGGSSSSSGVHNVRLLHSSPLPCVQKEQCTPLQPSRRSEQFVSPLQETSASQDLFSPCSTQRGQLTAGFQLTPEVQEGYVPQHSTGKTQRNAPALCSDAPANSQLSLFDDSDVLFDESENVSEDDLVSEWTSSLCRPEHTDMGGRERADSVCVALCRPKQRESARLDLSSAWSMSPDLFSP